MADFTIKQGDEAPSYVVTLTDARPTTWDLTGAAVTFSMRRLADGVLLIDHRTCSIVSAANRVVRLDWIAGDTDVAGLYLAEFDVTLPSGRAETFPDDGHLLIQVTAQIDTASLPVTVCSVDDLLPYLPDMTAAEAMFAAQVVIPRVEIECESYLLHSLIVAERTEPAIRMLPGQLEIPLRYSPVRSIASVSLDGDNVPALSYVAERNGLVLFFYGNSTNFLEPTSASVTYTGGLGLPVTDILKPALLSRMARLLTKFRDEALGTDQVSAERYATTYLSEGFTEDEMKVISPYRNVSTGLFTSTQTENWGVGHVERSVNWT